jgi:hypothetical protein
MTLEEAATLLGVPPSTLWHCANLHNPIIASAPNGLGRSKKDLWIDILDGILAQLKNRVDTLLAMPIAPEYEKVITMEIRELRGIITDLSRLEGVIGPSSVVLQQYNISINEMQGWLATNLCSECKTKFVQHLARPAIEIERS